MQLLHEKKALLMTVRDINMSTNMSIDHSDNMEVKEKRSSDASLLVMNPVASGDNVTTGLNSTHKLKEDLPALVPCCEGRELQKYEFKWCVVPKYINTDTEKTICMCEDHLHRSKLSISIQINEDLVRSGLSAISVKHDSVIQCLSMSRACEKMQVPPGLVKHRNSFRSLHRPDLKRVPYLRRMTPDELETLFRGYADLPGRGILKTDTRDEIMKVLLPPDENSRGKELLAKNETRIQEGNDPISLHPILETRSGAEDVPAGMRLHGTRARLYTSVLAGAKAGDQLDGAATNEDYDTRVLDVSVPDEEVQLHEELQIILPPRYDDVTADSSNTTTSTENSTS